MEGGTAGGGGSGAGIIDIYMHEKTQMSVLNLSAVVNGGNGGSATHPGFAGGNGSVTIGTIAEGTYEIIE